MRFGGIGPECLLLPRKLAPMVAGGVERQGVEPCPETAGAAEAADGRTQLDADLLGDVIRIG